MVSQNQKKFTSQFKQGAGGAAGASAANPNATMPQANSILASKAKASANLE